MKQTLRTWFMPWAASEQFPDAAAYRQYLTRRLTRLRNLRMLLLVAAAACLVVGFVLDRRPIMLLTTVPLLLVLAASLAMERMEAVMDGQDHTIQ